MGVLVNFSFNDLTEAEVNKLLALIGKEPLEQVLPLYEKMAAQIGAQTRAARDKAAADAEARAEAWRAGEREKLKAQLPKSRSTKSKKGR